MKKRIAVAIIVTAATIYPVAAITLEGSVEKSASMQRTWWQKLFGPEPEGRIGIRISAAGRIDYVHPSSPAEEAGLKASDIVMFVDGRKLDVEDISGEPGTSVHLVVKRHSDEFTVDIKRVDYHSIPK